MTTRTRSQPVLRPGSRRFWVALLLAVFALIAWPGSADADEDAERVFSTRINAERSAYGLPSLQLASDLVAVARAHAAEMAQSRRLKHNADLALNVAGWQRVAENVGVGSTVEELHAAFMASERHRWNILNPNLVEVGVGVARSGDRLWVTQVFRTPESQPPRMALPLSSRQGLTPRSDPAALATPLALNPEPAGSSAFTAVLPSMVQGFALAWTPTALANPFDTASSVAATTGEALPLPSGGEVGGIAFGLLGARALSRGGRLLVRRPQA